MNHMTHKQSFLIRTAALAGSIFFIPALPAQTPAWFPLEVGNAWLYRPVPTSGTGSANLEYRNIWVHGTESIDGRDYFDVLYFGREIALRTEPSDSSIYVFDKASGTEKLWLAPDRPVGSTFSTEVNPCPTTATIAARDAPVTTPAGKFDNAVEVEFQGNCVDVGATKQLYAANVGLVSDEETTFAGPVIYELSYYRVGTSTSSTDVSFTVALRSSRYIAGTTLEARLTLRNTTPDPIHLHFRGNVQGTVGYQWSADRTFPLIIRDETLGPGELTYGVTAPLGTLPPG